MKRKAEYRSVNAEDLAAWVAEIEGTYWAEVEIRLDFLHSAKAGYRSFVRVTISLKKEGVIEPRTYKSQVLLHTLREKTTEAGALSCIISALRELENDSQSKFFRRGEL